MEDIKKVSAGFSTIYVIYLQHFNLILTILIAVLTLTYLSLGIYKRWKEIKDNKNE